MSGRPRIPLRDRPTMLAMRRELTPNEYKVFICSLRAYSLTETAKATKISERTVHDLRASIYRKTGTTTQAELISKVMLPLMPGLLRAALDAPFT